MYVLSIYLLLRLCLDARDPYCGWDRKQRRCTTIEDSSNMSQWFQNITACPVKINVSADLFKILLKPFKLQVKLFFNFCVYINFGFCFQLRNQTTDGAYGPWVEWQPCNHDDGEGTSACLCRSRTCNSPSPRCGGRNCEGPTIEVSNCSRYIKYAYS